MRLYLTVATGYWVPCGVLSNWLLAPLALAPAACGPPSPVVCVLLKDVVRPYDPFGVRVPQSGVTSGDCI